METDVKEVVEEVVKQEVTPQETTEEVESTESAQSAPEDLQAKNIREMRLTKEKAEKERDEAYKLLQQMKEQNAPKPQPTPEPEEDLNIDIGEDEWVEPKHIKKVTKHIKKLEKQLQNYQQTSVSATTEARLKSKYSDFDKVVSKENVEILVRDHPELGDTLRSNKDLYSQAVTAYTMIKQLGVYKEDKYVADKAKAEQNAAKPRPLAGVSPQQGESPLSRANAFAGGLTPDLKAQLLKEMNEARSKI